MQVHEATVEAGAYPSPLNYGNFPKSVCTSVNEVREGLNHLVAVSLHSAFWMNRTITLQSDMGLHFSLLCLTTVV